MNVTFAVLSCRNLLIAITVRGLAPSVLPGETVKVALLLSRSPRVLPGGVHQVSLRKEPAADRTGVVGRVGDLYGDDCGMPCAGT